MNSAWLWNSLCKSLNFYWKLQSNLNCWYYYFFLALQILHPFLSKTYFSHRWCGFSGLAFCFFSQSFVECHYLDDLACLAQWNSWISFRLLHLVPHVLLLYCYTSLSPRDTKMSQYTCKGIFLTSINDMITLIKNNKLYFNKKCMCIFSRLNRCLSCFMGKIAQIAVCHYLNKTFKNVLRKHQMHNLFISNDETNLLDNGLHVF